MSTCIVCEVDLRQRTVPDTGYGSEYYPPAQTEYRGQTYQFCCSDHKETFQENPAAFVDSQTSETDG